jgi:hypothetical protein
MRTATALQPSAGENTQGKKDAGRMGGNPYDPLTTTNFETVDHG